MDRAGSFVLAMLAVALAMMAWTPGALAEEHNDVHLLEDIYTGEGASTARDITLNGDRILEAFFNFSVLDDDLNSNPDTFTFTVTNVNDTAHRQSLPGTTDDQGRLRMNFPFTRKASQYWRVIVVCNDAGDVMIGPATVREDNGNAWSLQVDYVYETDEPNGNGGDNGDGDTVTRPPLRTALEVNLIMVALLALLVVYLAIWQVRKRGGNLKFTFTLGLVILVDAFFSLPIALVVNSQQNEAIFATPPLGPEWLGNLAFILLVLWVVPLVLARKLVMTSPTTHDLLSRVIGEGLANAVRVRGERVTKDLITEGILMPLLAVLGIATVVVVALMLML